MPRVSHRITEHSLARRLQSLRALLAIVREKFPHEWRALVEGVRAAGGDVLAISEAIHEWLRARRLKDDGDVAIMAAWLELAREPGLAALRRGRPARAGMLAALRAFLPAQAAPEPVLLEAKYLLGEGAAWKFGVDFCAMRAQILADFREKLDAALAEYARNLKAAGLREEPVSAAERERLELLAEHLIGGRTAAGLAKERRHQSDARVRADLREAAQACGLRLRGPGRPTKS